LILVLLIQHRECVSADKSCSCNQVLFSLKHEIHAFAK
jgi:hypothetical protein